jgi:hypothetical protein
MPGGTESARFASVSVNLGRSLRNREGAVLSTAAVTACGSVV